jgi:transcriptional regulator with XRE-family HTH domain
LASFYPHLYQTILALLGEARERAGLSQAELGGRFGLTEQFVISYEDGSRLLDPAEYLAICRAIGVDPYRVLRDAERSAGGDACG